MCNLEKKLGQSVEICSSRLFSETENRKEKYWDT